MIVRLSLVLITLSSFLVLISFLSSCPSFVSASPLDFPDVQQRTKLELVDLSSFSIADVWHRVLIQSILLSPGFLPATGVSRAHALVAQAHFDAIGLYYDCAQPSMDYAPYVPNFTKPSKRAYSDRTQLNMHQSASYACYAVLTDVFATKPIAMTYLSSIMTGFAYATNVAFDATSGPAGLGQQVGSFIVAAGRSDGYNAHGTDAGARSTALYANSVNYYPVNNPQSIPSTTTCGSEVRNINHWQPLLVPTSLAANASAVVQKHMTPQVSSARTWALSSGSQFRPPSPPLMGTSQESLFREELQEMLDLTSCASMSDSTKMLAEFFFDGPSTGQPPSHMIVLALLMAKDRNLDLIETSKLLFLTAMALGDAGVAAWDSKMFHDKVRPITAIQCLFANVTAPSWSGPYLGVQNMPLANWKPYQVPTALTPPFSEYTSGYAVYAGAATSAIRAYFGSDSISFSHTFAAGSSVIEPRILSGSAGFVAGMTDVPNAGPSSQGYSPASDVTMVWTTLTELARDAAYSRRAGGIHFKYSDINGRILGGQVAQVVYDKYASLLHATQDPLAPRWTTNSGASFDNSGVGTGTGGSRLGRRL